MAVIFHPHALERMAQRGATEKQVMETVEHGEKFEAKFGRAGFRRNFVFEKLWRNSYYKSGSTPKKLVDYHMIIKGFIALWAPA